MTPFEQAWAITGTKEAGFSNHPADRGGPTKYGVTERVARVNGYVGLMQDITLDRVMVIAKKQYWDVLNLDAVAAQSQLLANEMFDTLYNGGEPGQWLQRCLNVLNQEGRIYPDMKVDGRVGPMTCPATRRWWLWPKSRTIPMMPAHWRKISSGSAPMATTRRPRNCAGDSASWKGDVVQQLR